MSNTPMTKIEDMETRPSMGQGKQLIVRHNKLIESRHKMTMSERRFILWNIAQLSKDDTSFDPFTISVRDYFDVIGLAQIKDPYQVVRKMHDRLTQQNVEIEYLDKKGKPAFSFYSWFSELRYEDGQIESLLNPKLVGYLLQLKEQFTTIALEQAMILNGFYTGRMYDLLFQYKKIGRRTITADFIRDRFKIEKKYTQFRDLRINVIDPAVKEINQKTDLFISYTLIKQGRKYVAFDFTISKSKATVTLDENREEQDETTNKIFKKLIRFGIKEKTARKLIAEYSDNRIIEHIEIYDKKKRSGEKIGPGWLIAGIEKDYRPQKSLFDDELNERVKERQQKENLKLELDQLQGIIIDIERIKRMDDIKVISAIYEKKKESAKENIEKSFLDSLQEEFQIRDFKARKWNSMMCIKEIRRFWYGLSRGLFTDISKFAEQEGINYRQTIKRIDELKEILNPKDQ